MLQNMLIHMYICRPKLIDYINIHCTKVLRVETSCCKCTGGESGEWDLAGWGGGHQFVSGKHI